MLISIVLKILLGVLDITPSGRSVGMKARMDFILTNIYIQLRIYLLIHQERIFVKKI